MSSHNTVEAIEQRRSQYYPTMFCRFVKFRRVDEYEDLDITEPEMREIDGMRESSESNTVPRDVFDRRQGNESDENKDSTEAVQVPSILARRGSYGTGKKERPLKQS